MKSIIKIVLILLVGQMPAAKGEEQPQKSFLILAKRVVSVLNTNFEAGNHDLMLRGSARVFNEGAGKYDRIATNSAFHLAYKEDSANAINSTRLAERALLSPNIIVQDVSQPRLQLLIGVTAPSFTPVYGANYVTINSCHLVDISDPWAAGFHGIPWPAVD